MKIYCVAFLTVLELGYGKSNNLTANDKPEKLTTFDWTSWEPCRQSEDCQRKRSNTCAETSNPYITCIRHHWLEKEKGCKQHCVSGQWHSTTTSECQGTTCRDRVLTRTQECVDTREQNGCKRTHTEFCNQEEECDGTWSQWQNQTPCLKSGIFYFQLRKRFCLKQGGYSSNCAATKQTFYQTNIFPCDPNNINPATRKTIVDPDKENDQPRRLSTTSSSTTTTPAKPDPQDYGIIKTYVFIIQSIVVAILLIIILYLVCYIKKQKKRKKLSIQVANNDSGPEATYNRLSVINNHGSDSEYEQMLPRPQVVINSRSSTPRPLPDTPTYLVTATPRRTNRRSSELHASLPSSRTSPKKLLEPPVSLHSTSSSLPRTRSSSAQVRLSPSITPYATHSAPVSPTRTPSKQIQVGRVKYTSLHKRDNYMKPFN